jgi:hypothetical protein
VSERYHLVTMRIAMVASECEPWAKTGGLADVVDALSRALGLPRPAGLGHEVASTCWYRGLTPPSDSRRPAARAHGQPAGGAAARL